MRDTKRWKKEISIPDDGSLQGSVMTVCGWMLSDTAWLAELRWEYRRGRENEVSSALGESRAGQDT